MRQPLSGFAGDQVLFVLLLELVRRQRLAEIIALDFVTEIGVQEIELLRSFHAFGDDAQTQAVAERDDGLGNRRAVVVGDNVTNEGLIDFEAIDREAFEVTQAGLACAKIVDGQFDANVLERAQRGDEQLGVVHDQAFRQLKLEILGAKTGLVEDLPD